MTERAVGGRVPAVGGERLVPAPDAIAGDYLLLALRLDQHRPGLVAAYAGPADLKARADIEQRRAPARLREDAAALRERVADEVAEPDRGAWLVAQLDALEAHAVSLAGEPLPPREHLARCLGLEPVPTPEGAFETAHSALDGLLPRDDAASLADRLAAWEAALAVPPERLADLATWLVERLRAAAARRVGLPEGEAVRVALVRGQPRFAHAWFDGGGRSALDLDVERRVAAPELLAVLAHETYPGHHLERAWREATLVEREGWLEHTLDLADAPAAVLSEGLAGSARRCVLAEDDDIELLAELLDRADVAAAGRSRETAERQLRVVEARSALRGVVANVVLMRRVDGAPAAEALAYLERWSLAPPGRCCETLEAIERPPWSEAALAEVEGERLVGRWLELALPQQRPARLGRLLREAFTPGRLRDELGAA
ncbi:MAG TPA: hypothetical protein VF763_12670 [Candidatus Limnocylindrales bacterium]